MRPSDHQGLKGYSVAGEEEQVTPRILTFDRLEHGLFQPLSAPKTES
jgi:hypothetical protein